MLSNIKAKRKLTVLITTHYMDEADRLCNRIAIVDHGKLVALDTPEALKASVPGSNVIEVQFDNPPANWEEKLRALPDVTSVQNESAGMFRVLTGNGSRTGGDGGGSGRCGAHAYGAEHHAGRCVCPLHGAAVAR
jgi:ABC-2 type transport system ATP-binding protein